MTLKPSLRLLPSVMLVCGGLLVLKASGIVHEAFAAPGAAAPADAMAPPPAAAHKDFAGDDGEIASAAEVDVLTSLSKRRSELDTREAQVQIQANMLAATETRVDSKIAQLKLLQSQIATLLAQRDAAQEKQIASLVKTYSAMPKPQDAARIFNNLPDEVLIPVAQGMNSEVLAKILAAMNPDAAQKLTLKLASKLTLPVNTPPAPILAPAAPDPAAAAAPSPQTQAAPGAPQTANATPAAKAPVAAPKPGG